MHFQKSWFFEKWPNLRVKFWILVQNRLSKASNFDFSSNIAVSFCHFCWQSNLENSEAFLFLAFFDTFWPFSPIYVKTQCCSIWIIRRPLCFFAFKHSLGRLCLLSSAYWLKPTFVFVNLPTKFFPPDSRQDLWLCQLWQWSLVLNFSTKFRSNLVRKQWNFD